MKRLWLVAIVGVFVRVIYDVLVIIIGDAEFSTLEMNGNAPDAGFFDQLYEATFTIVFVSTTYHLPMTFMVLNFQPITKK